MCQIMNVTNDPKSPHDPMAEPGRANGTTIAIAELARSLRYWWFILLPLLLWMVRMEVVAYAAVTRTELGVAIDNLPPEDYKDYVRSEFDNLNKRLDHQEDLLGILISGEIDDTP